jgi:hypothetical protein
LKIIIEKILKSEYSYNRVITEYSVKADNRNNNTHFWILGYEIILKEIAYGVFSDLFFKFFKEQSFTLINIFPGTFSYFSQSEDLILRPWNFFLIYRLLSVPGTAWLKNIKKLMVLIDTGINNSQKNIPSLLGNKPMDLCAKNNYALGKRVIVRNEKNNAQLRKMVNYNALLRVNTS